MYALLCIYMVHARECMLHAVQRRNWLAWVWMCSIVAALALKFIEKPRLVSATSSRMLCTPNFEIESAPEPKAHPLTFRDQPAYKLQCWGYRHKSQRPAVGAKDWSLDFYAGMKAPFLTAIFPAPL